MVLLPPPSVTGHIEEYDEHDGGSYAERTGGRRNRCLSLRPVGGVGADTDNKRGIVSGGGCSSPRADTDGSCDWNGGAGVELAGAGWCSHPHPHLYHLTWDDCRRCAVVVRLGATHDPKRKKVAFDPVVTVVPHYLLEGFRGGVVAATWRAMPNDDDDDDGRLLLQLPLPLPPPPPTTTTTIRSRLHGLRGGAGGCSGFRFGLRRVRHY
ncbi:hypothetical protein F5888DRAFT_1716908 [Russula emetica]|nr:hypothetical protein F5888DRAFT_1716908 [Russula emetica]